MEYFKRKCNNEFMVCKCINYPLILLPWAEFLSGRKVQIMELRGSQWKVKNHDNSFRLNKILKLHIQLLVSRTTTTTSQSSLYFFVLS
jgi:hypothetical protein